MKKLTLAASAIFLFVLAAFSQTSPELSQFISSQSGTGKVMDHAKMLIDGFGPRLSLSTELDNAQQWVIKTLTQLGLQTELKPFPPFSRSWNNTKVSVAMVQPYHKPMAAIAAPWTGSTNGVVRAQVIKLDMPAANGSQLPRVQFEFIHETTTDFAGKFVLLDDPRNTTETFESPKVYSDLELAALSKMPAACATLNFAPTPPPVPGLPAERNCYFDQAGLKLVRQISTNDRLRRLALRNFLLKRGALGTISRATGGNGLMFPALGDILRAGDEVPPPGITLSAEDHDLLYRLVGAGARVELEVEVASAISDDEPIPSNVIAEIRGATKPEEVVIIGAHLDSTSFSNGATDNAGNCAVLLEAARILKASNIQFARTMRFVFWNGEEQGFLGSQEYVTALSADERSKIVMYLNLDEGNGKIRGVVIHPKDPPGTATFLARWLAPLGLLGAETVSYSYFGASDSRSFLEVGIPAFYFLQDPLDYETRTHHSNMDTFEKLSRTNLQQEVAVVANILVTAANSSDTPPRR